MKIPFSPGRMDASQAEQPTRTRLRYWSRSQTGSGIIFRKGLEGSEAELLVDKANLLTLTAPEMTVLIGGLRVLVTQTSGNPNTVFSRSGGGL